MATASGYSIDAYCDGHECDRMAQFAGVSRRGCIDQARRDGWLISTKDAPEDSVCGGKLVLCPTCRKAAVKKL